MRDIEPQYSGNGDGHRRVGGAMILAEWSPGRGFAYKIEFGIYGVRGDDLLVRYEAVTTTG